MRVTALALLLPAFLFVSTASYGADPPAGSAQPPAMAPSVPFFAAEVLVLHATNGNKGIDPRIGDMPELAQAPFSSYKSYGLLRKVSLPLKVGEAKTYELPNGRVLQTKLLEVLRNDTVRISASINQPGGKTFLPLLEVKAKLEQRFIVAGQSYKGGILVLVIRMGSSAFPRAVTAP